MTEDKEHLTALAIKAAALKHVGNLPSELAVTILGIIEEKLVGQLEATDFRVAETEIYRALRQYAEETGI